MATYFKELIDKIECDPDIDEIGIIMGAPPPAIVLVEHKLGVSMGILKPMFVYAASEFSQLLLKLPSVTPGSEEHYALCRSGLDLSKAILLVKGDIGIAINFRKEMIVNGLLSCQEEIKFLRMLFTKHPKSPGGWQHRRFCLMQLLSERVPLIMELELELCRRMAELYPKNYYAWNHRLWLLPHMSLLQVLCCAFKK